MHGRQLAVLALIGVLAFTGCGNVEKLRKRNSRLQERLNQVTNQKEDAQEQLNRANDTIESLRSQLSESQSAKEKLNKLLDEKQQKKQKLQKQRQELEKLVKNLSGVGVRSGKQGNYIVLEDKILFELGKAQLSQEAKDTLDSIMSYLKNKTDQEIRIDGHTDGVPIEKTDWEDNYHLAAMRAHAVFDYLASKGIDSKRMHIAGFGPNEPRVKPPEPTAPVKKNRRVEILLMPEEKEIDSLLNQFD